MTHQLMDPAAIRPLVWDRQGGYCLRCHTPMSPDRWEAHHRRSRRALGWCPCNVVGLHPRCHTQGELAVHDHPEDAQRLGLIVPVHSLLEPFDVLVHITWPWAGDVLLTCDGMTTHPEALAPVPQQP